MSKNQKEKNEKHSVLILALILFLIGGLLFLKPNIVSDTSESLSSIPPQENVEDSIDRNLKAADIRLQLEALKVQIQNERASRIREYDDRMGDVDVGNLKTNQESHGEQVVKDIEEFQRRGDDQALDPSEIVERRIARDQAIADYDKKYRNEYIKAFLQNAREQGLEVQLNDDLEVVDIRETSDNEPMRFPNSVPSQGGAAQ